MRAGPDQRRQGTVRERFPALRRSRLHTLAIPIMKINPSGPKVLNFYSTVLKRQKHKRLGTQCPS
jgi:hypothetical protein